MKNGLLASPNEEFLRTRTFNNVTYYYIDELAVDDMKKRKLAEEKLITDFVSEREAFKQK